MADLFMLGVLYFLVRGISEGESKHAFSCVMSILAAVLCGLIFISSFGTAQ